MIKMYVYFAEALAGQGVYPPGLYQYPHLYPPPSGQVEATNLSLPSSSRSKQGDKPKEEDIRRMDDKRDRESRVRAVSDDRKETKSSEQCLDFSKHSETHCDRKRSKTSKTGDLDKIKSSSKLNQSSVDTSKSHTDIGKEIRAITVTDRKRHLSDNSLKRDSFGVCKSDVPSHIKTALHSPPRRHKAMTSPDRAQNISKHSAKKETVRSPYASSTSTAANEQDMPENLCIKDRQPEHKPDNETKHTDKKEIDVVKTQTVDTSTTVTVTSTLNIITTDIGLKDRSYKRKGKLSEI